MVNFHEVGRTAGNRCNSLLLDFAQYMTSILSNSGLHHHLVKYNFPRQPDLQFVEDINNG